MQHYALRAQTPDIATYRHLRSAASMSPKTEAAARAGLTNSLYSVMVFDGEHAVGMAWLPNDFC